MVWKKRDEHPVSWESLKGFIAPEILHAPKTGGDPAGGWPTVHERLIRYFLRNVTGTPDPRCSFRTPSGCANRPCHHDELSRALF
jgi:hypothetical protein